ncbi:hypothetical protein EAH_00021980 [Eimeria acervulina]|uniref:Uncharacterized protein n=1 Tax=Eimeria acervulina TaxID=5801 RepID=U6GMN6_EIMAC|nr:hypothetical protein EAH_00021980 [Eimeria acervulina]CDI81481.1 hypothetical protein EAH_00021980 [Eimeria acervulina]
MQIRRNAEELRAYLSDLREWEDSFAEAEVPQVETSEQQQRHEEEIETEDAKKTTQHQQHLLQYEDVKQQQQQLASENQEGGPSFLGGSTPPQAQRPAATATSNRKLVRDLNPLADYYKAWDAFNPDDETDREEENRSRQKPKTAKAKKASSVGSQPRPSDCLSLKGTADTPERTVSVLTEQADSYAQKPPGEDS